MRLLRIALRGLTRFTGSGHAEIDFDALGPGLVAITGPNGAGKTTIMEAAAAALWKTMPTRPGSLYDVAHGSDAYVEATFATDAGKLTARVMIDATRRTCESYLFLDGAPITDGKSAGYDAEVERRAGSLALYLAGPFAAQNKRGSFLDAKKGERKALFAELLSLGHLEHLAAEARSRATYAERELTLARARRADLARDLAALPALREQLGTAEDAEARARADLDAAREAERQAQAALERARGAAERIASLVSAELAARHALVRADRHRGEALELPRRAQAWAQERTRDVAARRVEEREPAARARHAAAIASIEARRDRIEQVLAELPDADQVAADMASAEQEMVDLRRADEGARAAIAAAGDARQSSARAQEHLALVRQRRDRDLADLHRRAEMLRRVPCMAAALRGWVRAEDALIRTADPGESVDLAGTCPLLADGRQSRERERELTAAPMPEVAAAEAAMERAQEAAAAVEPDAAGAERRARMASLAQRIAELTAAQGQITAAGVLRPHLDGLAGERTMADASLAAELGAASEARREADEQIHAIELDLAAELQRADEAIRDADAELRAAGEAHGAAESALAAERQAAGGATTAAAEHAAREAQGVTRSAEAAWRGAAEDLGRVRGQVQTLELREEDLAALAAQVTEEQTALGDWALLAQGLGKDGVQALEVDAAAPEVSALVNELLASCYGTRFSVTLETLREKRDGGYAEVFDLLVYDGGEVRPVEALSGGERVVVGEAVGLAIAILNARKNAIRWGTLWRDETAGALDPENAGRYVQMLRRARELGGFAQLLFVAHQPEVSEAADVRLIVDGGQVTVERQEVAA